MRRPGCPSRSSTSSSHSNQGDLHAWLRQGASNNMEGISQTLDKKILAKLMCYGFRDLSVVYGGNLYKVTALFNDPHSGIEWYPE